MNEQKFAQSLFVQLATCTIANSILLRGLFFHFRSYLNCKQVGIYIGYRFTSKEKDKLGKGSFGLRLETAYNWLISNIPWPFYFRGREMPSSDNSKWKVLSQHWRNNNETAFLPHSPTAKAACVLNICACPLLREVSTSPLAWCETLATGTSWKGDHWS